MSRALQFKQIIVLRNPVSTNAHSAQRQIAELQHGFPQAELLILETLPGGRPANERLLRSCAEKLGPATLLCVAAGDGTVNMVIETLLTDPVFSAEARRTVLLPLWCGNANDLAHMLNGRAAPGRLATVLQTGKIIKIHPLSCTLIDEKHAVVQRLAACYTSFGASASTAQTLSQATRKHKPTYRMPGVRFVQELVIAARAMSKASTFVAEENGHTTQVYEYVFFNGSRFAKVGGVKNQLTERKFHRAMVTRKRLVDVLLSIVALQRQKRANDFEGTHATFAVRQSRPIWGQFDGETMRIHPHTQIEVAIAEQPFYALSIRFVYNKNVYL